MTNGEIRERADSPSQHLRRNARMPVRTAILQGEVTADSIETLSAEKLYCMSDGVDAIVLSTVKYAALLLVNVATAQAQLGIILELGQQSSEVIVLEGNISIYVSDVGILEGRQLLTTGTDRMYLCAKVALVVSL
jgi:hypothetical protein